MVWHGQLNCLLSLCLIFKFENNANWFKDTTKWDCFSFATQKLKVVVKVWSNTERKIAAVNAKDDIGATPLHIRAYWTDFDYLKCFITNGANVSETDNDETDNDGNTPLHVVGIRDTKI